MTEKEVIELLNSLGIEVSSREDELLWKGGVDSLSIADIIVTCEDRFGIEIDGEDVIPENFLTVGSLADLIGRYTL